MEDEFKAFYLKIVLKRPRNCWIMPSITFGWKKRERTLRDQIAELKSAGTLINWTLGPFCSSIPDYTEDIMSFQVFYDSLV